MFHHRKRDLTDRWPWENHKPIEEVREIPRVRGFQALVRYQLDHTFGLTDFAVMHCEFSARLDPSSCGLSYLLSLWVIQKSVSIILWNLIPCV